MLLISPEQIRGSRAILRWSVKKLSDKSGVSETTIKRFESSINNESARTGNLVDIKTAIESSGKVLILSPNEITIVKK